MNDYDFFFWLNTIANILQIESYNLILQDVTNSEINNHLEEQDKVLIEQIISKLEEIASKNEEILRYLRK